MIEPTELRVGNYILFNNQPVMVKGVTANTLMLEGVMYETGNPNFPFDYKPIYAADNSLQPIPLCDTILQGVRSRVPRKSGFAYSYYGSRPTFLIYPDDKGYFIGMDYRGSVIHVTPNHVKNLHQLQNIYFAQYGVEMDIHENRLKQAVASAIVYKEI